MSVSHANLQIETRADQQYFIFSGLLTLSHLSKIETQLHFNKSSEKTQKMTFDLEAVERLDSAGAMMILSRIRKMEGRGYECTLNFSNQEFGRLLEMVKAHSHKEKSFTADKISLLAALGKTVIQSLKTAMSFLAFFGQMSIAMFHYLSSPRSIRWKEIMFEMNESAIKALGIVALTMFLVGIVIAYQSSVQLKLYGANIFIVDMLGISILRELAPMLTAIVVAGRSGSAYAAQIGVMKITEELDAMRTMGFDPYAFLVLPRILALMIMMPILIFVADITGVIGGMLISNIELGLSPALFLDRFAEVVDIRHFWVGLVKGPFFALLIASIGIFHGLMVKNDTQSIGVNTTKSVVEAIFAVIICDAVFSIIFTNLGI